MVGEMVICGHPYTNWCLLVIDTFFITNPCLVTFCRLSPGSVITRKFVVLYSPDNLMCTFRTLINTSAPEVVHGCHDYLKTSL